MAWSATGPALPIDPPRIEPPATGLVSLARPATPDGDRWMLGYAYRPETQPGNATVRSNGHWTSTGANLGGTNTDSTRVSVVPVSLVVEISASTLSQNAVDPASRASRALEAYTSHLLAHEFWTGEIAKLDSLPNPYLASGGAVTDITTAYAGPLAPQAAVGALMQALSDAGVAGNKMIHCSQYVGARTPDSWRNVNTLDDHGFVVVADSGYPGTKYDGTASKVWAYGTEIVNVRLGPIEIIPMDERENVDKTANTVTYRAQRLAAVDFFGPIVAVQVTP